ncbi:type I DNA topoisomerase [Carboxydothermus hydrogenoformans]|uniref:DNA topoisomerase 1 n=1 Tax=Carboxydothermus hydrogenoformans (strain ATCC BAA-161 / DSM 6008 / Z-2901) TaxID=246194 RepID=Q3AB70_CARHZ|nr:type I DNA topoisomerase [Carboxydothermus hydrogenoformans]ABB13842.1 DNA topoisomerase I [Carboxydothermus hydrogenoformans Z-2901]
MKKLVIVESPAKAKTIGKFLGKEYVVKASMGHIRDLPTYRFGVNIEKDFAPTYEIIRGKKELIKELKEEAAKAEKVYIASDPDREGEAIAWHVKEVLDLEDNGDLRIEFNEITKDAVLQAIANPRGIDYNRVYAQQARRILDRIVGYKLSPLLWRKIKKGLSAGRVQSVAVRLICEREEEIEKFVPEEYWSLTAHLEAEKKPFKAKLSKYQNRKIEIKNKDEVERIIAEVSQRDFKVVKITKKLTKKSAPEPFITSTLQQEASKRLNFSAKKTMQIAQALYEGLEIGEYGVTGLVTYIRTDSTRVAEEAKAKAAAYIKNTFGEEYVGTEKKTKAPKGKIQDAHEAIRPTDIEKDPEKIKQYLTPDQYKLYKLIWERFVASQMSDAQYDVTTVDIEAGDYLFRATGSILRFPGFTKIYQVEEEEGEKEEKEKLPALMEGQSLTLLKLEPKQHFTEPPPRYTEATLIKALEEKGIGRPSTYAPILETILKRGYVEKDKKQLKPTELGRIVVDLLKEHFPDIIDVEFTAEMEEKLDQIEEGEKNWIEVLRNFYEPFNETLRQSYEKIEKIILPLEETEEKCPNCGRNLVVRTSRFGKFLACPGYPECKFIKPFVQKTGATCPRCGGEIIVKKSKKGRVFYGCSNYPSCDFVSWDLPSSKKCPNCQSVMVEKRPKKKPPYLLCTNPDCKHTEPLEEVQ